MLRIFEKIILRRIYSPIKKNDIWRSKYNHDLYKVYEYTEPYIEKVIKVGRSR
jgi:hypothetical protein